jgi:putative ABC transport system permease protein
MIASLLSDLRLALRSLLRQPGFLAVAVLTLALGVGSVSAIYSVVNGTLLKPLPYPDAERIVRINRQQGNWGGPVSAAVLEDWRTAAGDQLVALGGFFSSTINLTGSGEATRLAAYRVTPEFWDVMALPALAGRYFGAEEEAALESVAVLSHGLWQRRFGGDPGVVGSDILLNGVAHRVLGVTPESFRYPGDTEVYLPTRLGATPQNRGNNFLSIIGRLSGTASLDQLDASLQAANQRMAEEYPDAHAGLSARIHSLPQLLNSRIEQPLLVLLGAAALVLLIACANLANLLLVRGAQRQRELAVRSALGGGRARLVRSVIAEAVVIALVGGTLGVALAALAVPALLTLAPGIMPSHAAPGVDAVVVSVSLLLALATVLLFSLWPALRAAAVAPAAALQEEGRSGSGGRSKARARSALVALEVGLSLTLLVGAGLLIESLRQIGRIDGGVRTEGVLTAAIVLEGAQEQQGEDQMHWYGRHTGIVSAELDRLLERIAAIPGVERVGVSDSLPLSGMDNISSNVQIVGVPTPDGQRGPGANWRFVSPDLFDTLGMRILRGRGLEPADQRPGEIPDRVLVNETFARRFLADRDPLGQELVFFDQNPKQIVGVVSDARLHGLEREVVPEVYMPHGHAPHREFHFALRVRGEPMDYAEPLRRAIAELNPSVPVFALRSMDQMVAAGSQMRRFNMSLMAVFSGVALLLAMLGLYGVIAYSVAQRRHEIGIRMSLGAAPASVVGMVLGQGLRLVALGLGLGLVGAVVLGRLIASQLYGVGALDPAVIASVTVLLALAAGLACVVPALRASRVHPMIALRND